MKSKGERGSPCRTPLVPQDFPLGLPLIIIEKWTEHKHPRNHFFHLSPNLFFQGQNLKSPNQHDHMPWHMTYNLITCNCDVGILGDILVGKLTPK